MNEQDEGSTPERVSRPPKAWRYDLHPESLRIARRHDLDWGPLGSAVVVVREEEARALHATIKELPSEFRRCWYHQPAGIAVLMATSIRHELSTVDANNLVKVFCHTAGLAYVELGSATAQSEDRCYSVDPDESFLIGERAARFRRIESTDGQEAAIADLGEQPQDLAVEVERSAHDDVRNEVYRAVGVRELWECPRSAPRILDLQTPDGIRPVEESRILAGVRAEHLPATIDEIKAVGGFGEFMGRFGREGGWTPPWIGTE